MSIDVVMLTKNSNKPWFRRVLKAIEREIPICHFIIVDGYSTDGTTSVVKEFFRDKLIIVKTRGSLGLSRYLGMKLVDTEWFTFIDSDVEILPSWFKMARKFIKTPHVYGIQGVFCNRMDKPEKHITVLSPTLESKEKLLITILRYGINKLYGADTAHVLLRKNVVDLINPCISSLTNCLQEKTHHNVVLADASHLPFRIKVLT